MHRTTNLKVYAPSSDTAYSLCNPTTPTLFTVLYRIIIIIIMMMMMMMMMMMIIYLVFQRSTKVDIELVNT